MQEIKNKIKVAVAAGLSALTLGATMAGALAANLGNLPSPFVVNNNMAGQIVVGANAAVPDVIAAAQISAALGQYMVSASSSGGSSSSTTAFVEDYSIAENNIAKKLTAATYPALLGFKEVSFTGADSSSHTVQYAETLEIDGVAVKKGASFSTSSDHYSTTAKLYLEVESDDTLGYYVDFKNTEINNNTISTDKSVKVEFLGDLLEITKVESGKITVRTGSKYVAQPGETVVWGTSNIVVSSVYQTGANSYGAIFNIDGTSVSIDAGSKDKIGAVEINVAKINVPWDASAGQPIVEFYVGSETGKAYTHGDAYIGEDTSHPAWKWYINTTTSGADLYLNKIGVVATAKNSLTSTYTEQKPIAEGTSLEFPGSMGLALSLVGTTVSDKLTYNVEASSQDVLVTSSSSVGINDGSNYINKLTFRFSNSDETDMRNVSIGYTDPVTNDMEWTAVKADSAENETVNWLNWYFTVGDSENSVRIGLVSKNATVEGNTDDYFTAMLFNISHDLGVEVARVNLTKISRNMYLGDDTASDGGELIFDEEAIGTYKYDLLSNYGVVFKSGDGSTSVQMLVPRSQNKVKVLLGKEGASVSTGDVSYTYVALNSEVAVLDSEANTNVPLIIVGGPYANTLAAGLVSTADAETFFGYSATTGTGKGVVKLYDSSETTWGVDAMLVAGWAAKDTRAAAYILGQYITEAGTKTLASLNGKTQITVSGTTVTGSTVESTE